MKKIKFLILFFLITNYSLAQKFAYVDTDYILGKIPEYNQAQDKLDNYSKGWQEEIEMTMQKIEKMYRSYQSEQILLTKEMKSAREDMIFAEEKKVQDLQMKYFGPEGMLFSKRQELIKPIQDKIYDAIQQVATNNKYSVIFDSSSDLIMLYTNNNLDKSDKVLELMGY
ncbi:OmpH family outer membrane protein [Bacteroidota bacterium]|nr:OmpH family outer membrane protein [Bacteroidota bacterium]MDC3115160.1 OmpH family outer membrane protein [Bacteroidota bacterium]MDC3130021.1 OmpH family outer membrane protein [Bacteroidota bacterium]MDC3153466.1 OmpH family outer membrane protein [Bacteroidota bacterium]